MYSRMQWKYVQLLLMFYEHSLLLLTVTRPALCFNGASRKFKDQLSTTSQRSSFWSINPSRLCSSTPSLLSVDFVHRLQWKHYVSAAASASVCRCKPLWWTLFKELLSSSICHTHMHIESMSKAECSGLSNHDVLHTSHANNDAQSKKFRKVYQHFLPTSKHFDIVTESRNLNFLAEDVWYGKYRLLRPRRWTNIQLPFPYKASKNWEPNVK